MKLRIESAVKINLVLNVLFKRTDGYHELQTVMQSVSLGDILEFAPANTLSLNAPKDITPDPQKNLVWQAAALFLETYRLADGVQITLKKNIPLAAGLAGGSTDCAGTLLGLNRFFNLNRPIEELEGLANRLGSDIAYCLHGGTFLAQGRGEILTKLPELPKMYGLILKPPFTLSTAAVYAKAAPGKTAPKLTLYEDGKIDLENLHDNIQNDLTKPALLLKPPLADYLTMVEKTQPAAWQMSGSGPSIFAFYKDESARKAASVKLAGCEIYPVETTDFAQKITEI